MEDDGGGGKGLEGRRRYARIICSRIVYLFFKYKKDERELWIFSNFYNNLTSDVRKVRPKKNNVPFLI